MKFSERTINVLKNFSLINNSILFKEGKPICTISPLNEISAVYKCKEEIPQDFAIFDLSKFLSAHSLFKNTEIEFFENYCLMYNDKRKSENIRYVFSEISYIKPAKYSDLDKINYNLKDFFKKFYENKIISLSFSSEIYSKILKACNILSLDSIRIVFEDGKFYVVGGDAKNYTKDSFKALLPFSETHKEIPIDHFEDIIISLSSISMIPDNYELLLLIDGPLVLFKSTDIEYMVAKNSS